MNARIEIHQIETELEDGALDPNTRKRLNHRRSILLRRLHRPTPRDVVARGKRGGLSPEAKQDLETRRAVADIKSLLNNPS